MRLRKEGGHPARQAVRAGRPCYIVFLLLFLAGCAGQQKPRIPNEESAVETSHHFYRGTFARVEEALQRAAADGIGAGRVVVRRSGQRVFAASFGTTLPRGGGQPVDGDTLFDVASLTKPMAGVPLALALEDANIFSLTDSPSPTLREALQHRTGLVDGGSSNDPDAADGAPYNYANSNYLQIQSLAARYLPEGGRQGLEALWQKLGVHRATFDATRHSNVVWSVERNRLPALGTPMDPMADYLRSEGRWPMAHSGLFATADDVALFGDSLLTSGDPTVARLRAVLVGGWEEVPRFETPPATILLSPGGMLIATEPPFAPVATPPGRIYYHTGYTGCLLWIDTATGTTVAVLTNGVPCGADAAWQRLAAAVVQAIANGTERGYRWGRN